MIVRLRLLPALLAILLFAASAASAQGEKIDLRLRLKQGQTFRFRTSSQTTGMASVGTHAESGSEAMTAGMAFVVQSVDSEGNAVLQATFENMDYGHGSSMGQDLMAQFNAAVSSSIAALKGRAFSVNVSYRGQVGSLEGIQEVVDGALASLQGQPESVKSLAGVFVRQSLHESSLRDGLRSIFSVIPDRPVEIGERWSRQSGVATPNLTRQATVYSKIISRADGVCKIKTYEQIDSWKLVSPFGVSMSMSGVTEGIVEVEEATGLLRTYSATSSLKGTASGNGQTAPASVGAKSSVTRY